MDTRRGATNWDDAFLALADGRRRRLCLALWHRGPEAGAVSLGEIRGLDTEHSRLELRHVHLPMLEENGFVGWDRERGTVERGPRFDEIVPLVEWFRERRSLDRTAPN